MKKKAIRRPAGGRARGDAPEIVNESELLSDLRGLIQSARQRIASVANATTTFLFWSVGRRLLRENLQAGRAAYGKQILATVSQELTGEFGPGFNYTGLTRMVRFAEWMTDERILVTLSQELSWSHFVELLPIKEPLARDFYAEMCRIERWDVRTLRQKIGGMLFERTALSRRPKAVVAAGIATLRDGQMTPDLVFRDPYVLDLLGLKGAYSEHDLESAILPYRAASVAAPARAAASSHRTRPRERCARTSCHRGQAMSDLPVKSELLLQNMFEEGELQSEATHKEFLSVRREGKRDVQHTLEAIGTLAGGIQDLQRQAAQQYKPVVDDILRSGSRDVKQIEHTLDGLLDFCGHEAVLEMYKRLCRHYWDIDPAATADYVNTYRQYWDSENDRSET